MKNALYILWWLMLLAALPTGLLMWSKWHDGDSSHFALVMMGVYLLQAIYHLVQTVRMFRRHRTWRAGGHVIGVLVSVGLLWGMMFVWAMHWAGTSTNPPE